MNTDQGQIIKNVNLISILYNRHGQSAARGPHAARQIFFAALEFSMGLKIFAKCTH